MMIPAPPRRLSASFVHRPEELIAPKGMEVIIRNIHNLFRARTTFISRISGWNLITIRWRGSDVAE